MSTNGKRLFFMLVLSAQISGCMHEKTVELGAYAPYVRQFEADSRAAGKPLTVTDLKVVPQELDNNRMASCVHGDGMSPTISVDPRVWETLTEVERQAVLEHELGHCILNREHRDDENTDGIPLSIMNSRSIPVDILVEYREQYLKELFEGAGEISAAQLE